LGGRLVTRPPAFRSKEPVAGVHTRQTERTQATKCSKPARRLLGKELDIMYNPALQDQCEWLVVKLRDRG